jgi:glucose/arabinose dehydrogenase
MGARWLRDCRRLAVASVAVALLAVPVGERSSGAAAATQTLPGGFQDTVAFSGLTNPTSIRFASDGRIFVAQKNGMLKVFDSLSDSTPTTVIDLSGETDDYWDRGLLGMTLDPGFPAVPYVYLMYTYDAPPGQSAPVWSDGCPTPPGPTTDGCPVTGKLIRIQVAADDTLVGSPTTLISNQWCQQYPSHSIGDLNFGPDGMLYASAGEGANFNLVDYGQGGGGSGSPTPKNPCGDPPAGVGGTETAPTAEGGSLRSQSLRRPAGEPVSLDGTLLRLDPSTGLAANGNPNSGASDANARRIVAYGFRNPFRFTFRPGTSEVWVGDVGSGTWEEVDRLTSIASAVNFGWPCYEGNSSTSSGFKAVGLNLCTSLYSAGTAVGPYYTYQHGQPLVGGDTCPTANGSSITGVSFYTGTSYPSGYNGALFFADHTRDCIWAMLPGSNGLPDPTKVQPFDSGAANPVDLVTGPNGDLFYADLDDGTIHRITYQAQSCSAGTFQGQYFDNTTLSGSPAVTRCDANINFNWGTGSPDPAVNADQFSARWTGQFSFSAGSYTFSTTTDDGVRLYVDNALVIDDWHDQTATTTTSTISLSAGTHTVKVEYYDNTGSASANVSWHAGADQPPVPVVDSPASSLSYAVGDPISFSGHATDPEDGTVPASRLTWTLLIHHCPSLGNCHVHTVQSWSGVAGGSFNAPDHDYPSSLELQLTATDSQGAAATTSVTLQPKTVDLTFKSSPSGLNLTVGSETGTTPFTRTVIVNSLNSVSADSPQTAGGTTYAFGSWSDGGAASHDLSAPASTATYTATYTATSSSGGGGSVGSGGGSPSPPPPSPPPPAPAPLAVLDLGASLTGPASANVGDLLDYIAELSGAGSAQAADATLTVTVPATLAVVSLPTGCTSGTGTITCRPAEPFAGSAAFAITLRALGPGAEELTATAASSTADPNSANNTTSLETVVKSVPVRVTKSRTTPASPHAGHAFTVSFGLLRPGGGAVRPSRISCSATVGGKAASTKRVYRSGRVQCSLVVPARTKAGALVRVTVTAFTPAGRTQKIFNDRVR